MRDIGDALVMLALFLSIPLAMAIVLMAANAPTWPFFAWTLWEDWRERRALHERETPAVYQPAPAQPDNTMLLMMLMREWQDAQARRDAALLDALTQRFTALGQPTPPVAALPEPQATRVVAPPPVVVVAPPETVEGEVVSAEDEWARWAGRPRLGQTERPALPRPTGTSLTRR